MHLYIAYNRPIIKLGLKKPHLDSSCDILSFLAREIEYSSLGNGILMLGRIPSNSLAAGFTLTASELFICN